MADQSGRNQAVRRGSRWELLGCALHGHELLGTDAAKVRPSDSLVVRDGEEGLRWYRCLRCDAWLPLPPPDHPQRTYPPDRDEIAVPLRGKPLRDRYVLRLIALDRCVHFIVLAAVAAGILLFVAERARLQGEFYTLIGSLQTAFGPDVQSSHGILADAERAFNIRAATLLAAGLTVAAYAVLEGIEAVGLWLAKRWAEYLTFVATTVLLIPEIYELTGSVSITKLIALLINLAVVAYLLFAKRLFGIRGGGRAEQAERDRDTGWPALERAFPTAS